MVAPISALILGVALIAGQQESTVTVVDEDCALEVSLPGSDWKLDDTHTTVQGRVAVKLYSPLEVPTTRFTIVQTPMQLAGEGLKTRAVQIGRSIGQTLDVTDGSIGGLTAERMEYRASGHLTIEYGVRRGELFQVIQVSAPEAEWEDPTRAAVLQAIFDSVRFVARDETVEKVVFDATTPDQVREQRRAAEAPARRFAIRAHDVAVEVSPAEGRLSCSDQLLIEALEDGINTVDLILTFLTVDSFQSGEQELTWTRSTTGSELGGDGVSVTLPRPLASGETIELKYQGHADDYFFAIQQQLVAEVEMLGQVREESTFSSHVVYYPIDRRNDASVRISLTVPEGYVAVTGGNLVGESTADDSTTFTYETTARRIRQLPFGFAVGRYQMLRAEAAGGLEIEFYFADGFEERAAAYLELGRRAGHLFHERMGPLPWNRVAICCVDPERREMGVSLPGQILISSSYFIDLATVEPDGSNLSDPSLMGYLLVPDELSHQWNFYSTPLPNELAEGVSTFTNLLFLEQEQGAQEYLEGVAFCAGAYLAAVSPAMDVALANPRLYASDGYRTIAFCKVPAVLHNLRVRLGDETFFEGWRRAFQTIREPDSAYRQFREAFETVSGEDLQAFFDGWFFTAGHPRIEYRWTSTEVDEGVRIELTLRQVQNTGPFQLEFDVEVENAAGSRRRFRVSMRRREEVHTWILADEPVGVVLDPEGVSPLRGLSP